MNRTRRIKRKLSKFLDAHPQIDHLFKEWIVEVEVVKKETKANKESNKDLKDRIKAMEVKIKILENLLARHIPDYSEEILKVYWHLGNKNELFNNKGGN